MAYVEEANEFVHRHEFLVGAWVPAEEGQHVDHGLGEVALLAVAAGDFAALGVVPLEREDGEA